MRKLPSTLSVRLGPDASKALEETLDTERLESRDHVLTIASERFERRLIDEAAKLRVEMANLASTLRQEMAKDRFELLKWMFLFWIGQLAAISAIMSFQLRK